MTVWTQEGATGALHQARAGIEFVAAPLRTAGSVISTPFRAVAGFFDGLTTEATTVAQLRQQNEELQSQAIRIEEYRKENERLTNLLKLKEAYGLDAVGARVISTSPDSWNRVITINKGSVAGLSVGMPVLSANGLIGQIENVSPYSSVVRLITDEVSGVAAFLQTNRAEGIVAGSVDGVLYFEFILLGVAVQPGDTLVTSGAGGVFPKGIPIGEVLTVDHAPSDVYQTITVKPITRVSAWEEVLVLIGSEAEIQPAASEQGIAQGATNGQDANQDSSSGAGD
ncbi:MAG: rod shape-determining protein MreC [Coriobacteriales bacterium]|nr:rod shape-determining protein MreC [Coriobacteriales bacterium]